jgi:hypothetical protein
MTNATKEFRFLGLSMVKITIGYGLLLIVWAALFSIGSKSFTSWIPAMIGAPILLSGLLSHQLPARRKMIMHIAVLFGLFAFLGGFRFFSGLSSEAGLFGKPKAAASQLMLLITGGVYTFSCVRSFIWARKNRTAEANEG